MPRPGSAPPCPPPGLREAYTSSGTAASRLSVSSSVSSSIHTEPSDDASSSAPAAAHAAHYRPPPELQDLLAHAPAAPPVPDFGPYSGSARDSGGFTSSSDAPYSSGEPSFVDEHTLFRAFENEYSPLKPRAFRFSTATMASGRAAPAGPGGRAQDGLGHSSSLSPFAHAGAASRSLPRPDASVGFQASASAHAWDPAPHAHMDSSDMCAIYSAADSTAPGSTAPQRPMVDSSDMCAVQTHLGSTLQHQPVVGSSDMCTFLSQLDRSRLDPDLSAHAADRSAVSAVVNSFDVDTSVSQASSIRGAEKEGAGGPGGAHHRSLLFDEILNCYFDPVTGEYFEVSGDLEPPD